jgi:hypothetical protein
MQCPRCHAENRQGRRFCGECGLSFAIPCPACGFLNEGGEKFAYRASRRTDDAARLATDAVRLAPSDSPRETKPAPCCFSVRATRTMTLWRLRRPKTAVAGPSRSLRSSGCARSAPTATRALASYQRIGRREQAQQRLVTATRMYREMDMQFWLERAEAETNSSA